MLKYIRSVKRPDLIDLRKRYQCDTDILELLAWVNYLEESMGGMMAAELARNIFGDFKKHG